LNIGGESIFDDSIVKIKTHTYNPYANTFEYSDVIRIFIQARFINVIMRKFYLYRRKIDDKEKE